MAADETRFLIDEAIAALARVSEAWPWLAEVRVPGKGRPIERRPDMRDAARIAEAYRRDRAIAIVAAARGLKGAGPHADAGRVGPIAARAHVAHELRRLVEHLSEADTLFKVLDPASRPRKTGCRWCAGTGAVQMPAEWAWHWPDERLECPRCHGHGEVPYLMPCVACRTTGPCDCDHADGVVAVALPMLAALLPAVTDTDTAAYALRVVDRADRDARNAAGCGEDRRVIKAPCPACGRFELYAEVSSVDRTLWVMRCGYYACACQGPACGCGRDVRWPGRRHLWPAREWDGPDGLAARLGVDLPGTARVEAAA